MRSRRIGRIAVRATFVALVGVGAVVGSGAAAFADDFQWDAVSNTAPVAVGDGSGSDGMATGWAIVAYHVTQD